jgi:carboxylate-amine ligase
MSVPNFRGNDRPTVGVELELQLLDARTLGLANAFDRLVAGLDGGRGSVKPEFHQCCVEVVSDPCRTAAGVEADLAARVAAVARAAGRAGLRLGWGGTHPFSRWRDQRVTAEGRYLGLADELRETVLRPVTFGLHVHVGVGSGDAAARAIDRLRPYLPALLALSANSPFWQGRPTGHQAHRVELLEVFPSGGTPPPLRDWAGYLAIVEPLLSCGAIATAKELWWDARPSPENGTVEVRICDMPPDLPTVAALVALIQCLVHALAEGDGKDPEPPEWLPLMIRKDRWRAARYGLSATLTDPERLSPTPARGLLMRLADDLIDVARELGCARELAHARALAAGPNGAERQLAAFARSGDLVEVARGLSLGVEPDDVGVPPAPALRPRDLVPFADVPPGPSVSRSGPWPPPPSSLPGPAPLA